MTPDTSRFRKWTYWLAGLAGAATGAAIMLVAVFTSKSSTAAIGLIFVPFLAAVGAAVGAGAAFTGFTIIDLRARRLGLASGRVFASVAMVAAAVAWSAGYASFRVARDSAADPQTDAETLAGIPGRWLPFWRDEVLQALARNPSTPPSLLESLARGPGGESLLQTIGAHPSVPASVIAGIATQARSYARDAGLAGNPRIPPEIADKFERVSRADFRDDLEYKLYQTFVLGALAQNPSTPKAVFERIAARENPEYFLAIGIIRSPHASCAQIARAGEGGSDVLRATAQGELGRRGC